MFAHKFDYERLSEYMSRYPRYLTPETINVYMADPVIFEMWIEKKMICTVFMYGTLAKVRELTLDNDEDAAILDICNAMREQLGIEDDGEAAMNKAYYSAWVYAKIIETDEEVSRFAEINMTRDDLYDHIVSTEVKDMFLSMSPELRCFYVLVYYSIGYHPI
jgi:hypothetical protein